MTAHLGTAFVLRLWLINRLVKTRPYASQSTILFVIDFVLITMAGVGVALFNTYVLGFAWLSGLEVAIGFATGGLLPALDLSLEWEYRIIRSINRKAPDELHHLEMSPQTRKFTLVSCTIIVFVSLVLLAIIWRDIAWLSDQSQMTDSLNELLRTIALEVIFVMTIILIFTLLVIFSYSRNLKLLFGHQTRVLDLVSRGIFTEKVPVVTNDEFALIAGHTNKMIDRLIERERMSQGLELAKQIQTNLLPRVPPLLPGIEVFGKCLFSDEAGGDFYDYVVRDCGHGEEIVLIVADATGHSVGSALLMASARAYLHAHLQDNLDLIEVMQRTNKLVCQDVTDSGYVVTVFLFSYTPSTRTGQWVSAGHDPALFRTFGQHSIDELAGEDIPLGVDPSWQYSVTSKRLEPGLLCIGTDGIWEATNGAQEMFGKDRLLTLLLQVEQMSPATVIDAIFDQVKTFIGSEKIKDDRTLVIGRIT